MLDLFNTPTPQTANYQEFHGAGDPYVWYTWNKPRGVSMVRILCIGAGGGGAHGTSSAGGGGGGSGAVTSWIGPAMFIPDSLQIAVAGGGLPNSPYAESTGVYARINQGQYLLFYAEGGYGPAYSSNGGTAMGNNYFGACGIFTSITGQKGGAGGSTGTGGSIAASGGTFLSGGAGGSGGAGSVGGGVTPNYGYPALSTTAAGGTTAAKDGYFVTQPILVGCGGAGGSTSTTVGTAGGKGGIGCGGGGAGEDALTGGGKGGDGAVFIWSW